MNYFFVAIILCAVLVAGCGTSADNSTNVASTNSNMNTNVRLQNVNASDLPPGLTGQPLNVQANVAPGIPAANSMNSMPKGTTPTPGIPDPATLGKPMKPGATPTPGIPDPVTLKKQMEAMRKQLASNSNQPATIPPAGSGDGQMMRKQRKVGNINSQP